MALLKKSVSGPDKILEPFKQARQLGLHSKELSSLVELLSSSVPSGFFCFSGIKITTPLYYLNDKLLLRLGYERTEFVQQMSNDISAIIYEEDTNTIMDCIQSVLRTHQEDSIEFRMFSKNNALIWLSNHMHYVKLSDGTDLVVGILVDITSTKITPCENHISVKKDSKSGFYDRDLLFQNVEQYLTEECPEGLHALFKVELADQQQISSTFSQDVKDTMIDESKAVIKRLFRETDIFGRVNEFEFLVLLKNVGAIYTLRRKAEELVDALQDLYGIKDIAEGLLPTVGIALYQGNRQTFEELYAQVTLALHKAKSTGKKHYFLLAEETGSILPMATEESSNSVHLEALLRYMDGGVALVELSESLNLIYTSPSYEEALGRNKRKFGENGELLFQKIHPADKEGLREAMEAGAENWEPVNISFRSFSDQDEIVWRHVRAVRVPYESRRGPVMLAVVTDITHQKEQETAVAESGERVRIAFEQTSRTLWEVDIAAKSVAIFDSSSKTNIPQVIIQDCPAGMITTGWVRSNSAEAYTQFFNEIIAGKPEGKDVFFMRYTNNSYGWASMSYHMLYDEAGKPRRAIGVMEELPTISNDRDRFRQEEQMIESMRLNLLAGIKVNLTTDQVEAVWSNEHEELFDKDIKSYTALTERTQEWLFLNEDITLYGLRFSLNSLIEAYANGNNWITMEYRRKDDHGNVLWTTNIVRLLTDPITRQLYGFVYIRDVDKRRALESALPVTIERDDTTHLYSMQTMERLIHGLIQNKVKSDKLYSFVVIQISGFNLIKVEKGDEGVKQERVCIGRVLSIFMDNDCFVGQNKEDELIVFCPNAPSDEWMRQRIEHVLLQIRITRKNLGLTAPLVFVAGVATERSHNATFTDMFSKAVYVCEQHKNATADAAVSFSYYSENLRITDDDLEERAYISVKDEESERPLSSEEKNTLFECMQAMLAADQYDASINDILDIVGRYYEADKVYTLLLVSDDTAVSVQHEWVAPGKHSLMWSVNGMPLDKIFILKRSMAALKPILLGRAKSQTSEEEAIQEKDWRYIAVPFLEKGSILGFLCIENPKEHSSDTALLTTIMPMMLHERNRFGVNSDGMQIVGRDGLTGLMDRRIYADVLQTFNSDAYSTLGILHIAVVDLEKINRDQGIDAGDHLLVTTAQLLIETFKRENVYRVSGSEFVAICGNRTKETFSGSCIVLQSKLQRRFPKQFAFGETWSNKNLSARQMAKNAERLMRYSNPGMRDSDTKIQTKYGSVSAQELKRELELGHYIVYLQPKVDMRNNKIIGAEALVRYQAQGLKTIPPSEFIPMLESAHLIRELDFYVMDRALATMQQWMDEGKEPVPLSVNFSRQTLLDTSALASALAIHSRYDIPASLIEIEVTETLGDFETATIYTAISQFREFGFRFSLDDFGSQYSNLGLLGEVPFDTIKLDKSYTSNFSYNDVSRAILESIIHVCEKNGMRCIAEGIETEAQAQILMGVGCYYAQGYFYGKPMPIKEFEQKYLELEYKPGEGGNVNE